MFELRQQPTTKWDTTAGCPQPISLVPIDKGPLAGETIFTMGSCFALELRHELAARGHETYPRYGDLDFSSGKAAVGRLPERDNVNHYSIASIVQEFRNILAGPVYTPDLFWDLRASADPRGMMARLAGRRLASTPHSFEINWQDPFRTNTYAETLDDLTAISSDVTAKIREGAQAAGIFIVTLGMSEIWVDRRSGLAVCNAYGGKIDDHLCEFVDLGVEQSESMIEELVSLIREINPQATVVFSVSPVPLSRTAKNESVVTANMVSKAKQRVAVDSVCRRFENVHYFPSFELCQGDGERFDPDGRHVKRETVQYIVESFLRWYEGGEVAADLAAASVD